MSTSSYSRVQLFYDGELKSATSEKTFQTINPATAQPLADVTEASPSDIDAAVASAKAALPSWSSTSPVARARILQNAVKILRERNDELARIETDDTGKPFSETSTVDVITGADALEYYANLVAGGGLNGETVHLREDAWVYTRKYALGVCVGIGAWNYPLQIALWKAAPCLAAGNTMVYKPSEVTPLHATGLAEIFKLAGLPAGVFNVVQGGPSVGAALTAHPDVAKVSFTGQVSTGQKVAASAAGGMKSITMELGGKSPLIILPDASIDNAVAAAMMANFFSSGQVCTNGTRVFVHKDHKQRFEEVLMTKMPNIRPGNLFDERTNFGPLVGETHFKKVRSYIQHGIEVDKARLLCGGLDRPQLPPDCADELQNGYFVAPTVFTECTDDMRITKEEIFGPVMTILTYDSVDEAIARANNTPLGLAAGVVTPDLSMAHKVVARLDAGITWINTWGESPAEMSVGGWKMSGIGVENGREGIEAWVRTKSTLLDTSGAIPTVFSD